MCYLVQNYGLKGNKKPQTHNLHQNTHETAPSNNNPRKPVKRGTSAQPFLWLSLTPCPGVRISEEPPHWLQNKTQIIHTANFAFTWKYLIYSEGRGGEAQALRRPHCSSSAGTAGLWCFGPWRVLLAAWVPSK